MIFIYLTVSRFTGVVMNTIKVCLKYLSLFSNHKLEEYIWRSWYYLAHLADLVYICLTFSSLKCLKNIIIKK